MIIRQGNAGVTVNNAERVPFSNNTIVDNAYLNQIMKQPNQSDSKVEQLVEKMLCFKQFGDPRRNK